MLIKSFLIPSSPESLFEEMEENRKNNIAPSTRSQPKICQCHIKSFENWTSFNNWKWIDPSSENKLILIVFCARKVEQTEIPDGTSAEHRAHVNLFIFQLESGTFSVTYIFGPAFNRNSACCHMIHAPNKHTYKKCVINKILLCTEINSINFWKRSEGDEMWSIIKATCDAFVNHKFWFDFSLCLLLQHILHFFLLLIKNVFLNFSHFSKKHALDGKF